MKHETAESFPPQKMKFFPFFSFSKSHSTQNITKSQKQTSRKKNHKKYKSYKRYEGKSELCCFFMYICLVYIKKQHLNTKYFVKNLDPILVVNIQLNHDYKFQLNYLKYWL